MKNLFTLLVLFSSLASHAASIDPSLRPPSFPTVDVLFNGGFEAAKSDWSVSAGTFSINTSTPLNGKASGAFLPSAGSQILSTGQHAITEGLKSASCSGSIYYKVDEPTNQYTLRVINGSSVVLASSLIPNSPTSPNRFAVSFPCPTTGTMALQVVSSGSAAAILLDDVTLGKNNILNISQASLYGTLTISSCGGGNFSTNNTIFDSFTDSGCTYTATGNASAPSTTIAAIKFASLPPGEYALEVEGALGQQVAAKTSFFQFTDGTNTAREISELYNTSSATIVTPGIHQSISYSSPQSNVTLELKGKNDSGGTAFILASGSDKVVFKVYRFPTQSEMAVAPETINWKVDALQGNGSIALAATGTVSAFTELSDTSNTLNTIPQTGSLSVQVPCSTTNPSTGLTCGAGFPDLGVVFNLPAAGDVKACVNFINTIGTGATAVNNGFDIVETPNDAQTILQQANTTDWVGSGTGGTNTYFSGCGILHFASSGQKTLRLNYVTQITGTASANVVETDGFQNRQVHWVITPITQNVPAPILVGTPMAFRAESTPSGSAGTSIATVIFPSLGANGFDTVSRYNTGTGEYTIASPGLWEGTCQLSVDATYLTGYSVNASIYKNSTLMANNRAIWAGSSSIQTWPSRTNTTFMADIGDIITCKEESNIGGSWPTNTSSNTFSYFEIHQLH